MDGIQTDEKTDGWNDVHLKTGINGYMVRKFKGLMESKIEGQMERQKERF